MRAKWLGAAVFGAIGFLSLGASAWGAPLTGRVFYTGIFTSGTDGEGFFGAAGGDLTGKPLSIEFDEDYSILVTDTPTLKEFIGLNGSVLTVSGHGLNIQGTYPSFASYGRPPGAFNDGSSSGRFSASDDDTEIGGSGDLATLQAHVISHSPAIPADLTQAFTYAVQPGDDASGSLFYETLVDVGGTFVPVRTTGLFDILSVSTVMPVPLPPAVLMFGSGLVSLGAAGVFARARGTAGQHS